MEKARKATLFVVSALGVLVVLLLLLAESSLLDIDEVEIEGAGQTPEALILEVANVEKGDRLLGLSTGRISEDLEKIRWVKNAEVSKSWGGKLTVSLEERQPAAYMYSTAGFCVLGSGDGKILQYRNTCFADDYPFISGVEVSGRIGAAVSEEAGDMLLVASQFSPEMNNLTLGLVMDSQKRIFLRLKSGGWIVFGTVDQSRNLALDKLRSAGIENPNSTTLQAQLEVEIAYKLDDAVENLNDPRLTRDLCGDGWLDIQTPGQVNVIDDRSCSR